MKPMVQRRVEVFSEGADLLRELALKSREHVVELEGVSVQVDPSGLCSEDGKGLAAPQTIGSAPVGNIWEVLPDVLVKAFHVALPLESALLSEDVLQEDLSPLGMADAL